MKTKLLLSILMTVFVTNQSHAEWTDVTSTGSEFIKVSITQDSKQINKRVKFELCADQKDTQCKLIGDRAYSMIELEHLQNKLNAEIAGSTIVTGLSLTLAAAGAFFGGGAFLSVFGPAALSAGGWVGASMGAGMFVGSVGGAALALTSKYNPYSIYERRVAVSNDVIEDKPVKISGGDKSIIEFSKDLDTALKSID